MCLAYFLDMLAIGFLYNQALADVRSTGARIKYLYCSRLKWDDCSLKGKPASFKICSHCDLYILENLNHILMQCPYNQPEFTSLIGEITAECCDVVRAFASEPSKIFYWLLGKSIPGVDVAQMNVMRVIAGTSINTYAAGG